MWRRVSWALILASGLMLFRLLSNPLNRYEWVSDWGMCFQCRVKLYRHVYWAHVPYNQRKIKRDGITHLCQEHLDITQLPPLIALTDIPGHTGPVHQN